MTQKHDFTHTRGDTYNQEFIFKNEDGSFVNLTGCVIKFTLREIFNTPIVIQKTLTITDVVGGKAKNTLSKTETSGLKVKNYEYDYEMTDSGGIVTTLLKGKFSISEDVTY